VGKKSRVLAAKAIYWFQIEIYAHWSLCALSVLTYDWDDDSVVFGIEKLVIYAHMNIL